MAKVIGKGSKLQHTISAMLTDIAQLISIEHSGCESMTYDSTTLDGGVYKTYDPTGYSEPGTVTAELFYDSALTGHKFIQSLITTPADNAMKIIYANAVEQSFTAAGVGFGATIVMDDGVKGTATYKVDGSPGWPT